MPEDPNIWSSSTPQVQNGDPVNAASANKGVNANAERLAALKATVDSLQAGQQLVLQNANLSDDTEPGHIVYLNTDDYRQHLAFPAWQDPQTTNGRMRPAPESIYTGMVLTKDAAKNGNVLLYGLAVLETAELTSLFGTATPATGVYYLSAESAGQVTNTPPPIAVRCLNYLGSGLVHVFPFSNDSFGHTHSSYRLLAADWVAAGSLANAPDDATYGYDMGSAQALAENLAGALLPNIGEASFVYVLDEPATFPIALPIADDIGKHIDPQMAYINADGIWWFADASPAYDIDMSVVRADARDIPFVHGVRSLTDWLLASMQNGRILLQLLDFESSVLDDDTALAVKSIVGNQLSLGPVLVDALAGAGISVSVVNGVATIAYTGLTETPIQASIQNLDNVVTIPEPPYVFFEFPTNKLSKIHAVFQLPELNDDSAYNIEIVGNFRGTGSLQTGPTVTSAVAVAAGPGTGVTPSVLGSLGTFPDVPADASKHYTLAAPTVIDATGLSRAQIAITIEADNPTTKLRLFSLYARPVLK